MVFIIFFAFLSISTPAVCGLLQDIDAEQMFEQEDACLIDGGSDCAMALLQRKAALKLPTQRASISTAEHGKETLDHSLIRKGKPKVIYEKNLEILIEDPGYISLLKQVKTFSGGNLYRTFKHTPWPGLMLTGMPSVYWNDYIQFNFPNNALYAWGSNHSSILYVFAPGTNSLCINYGPTLSHVASALGIFAVCPQFVNNPTSQESVMKPACVVEWALSWGNFSTVILGGHSGGASAVPATARVLMNKSIKVDAMIMQHPGIVYSMNVPGCASSADSEDDAAYCAWYFPTDLMAQVSKAKLMIISGNFCEWTKVQNSNWLSNYACDYNASSNPPLKNGTCPNLTFPTPSIRPMQPPVTCDTGCPDASFLLNPGDCMVETYAPLVRSTYLPNFTGKALSISSCGEHAFAVLDKSGLKEEGRPFVRPYLKYVIADTKSHLNSIIALNGTTGTCWSTMNIHDMCLVSVSPYHYKLNPFYTKNGSISLCKDANKTSSSGPIDVLTKNM